MKVYPVDDDSNWSNGNLGGPSYEEVLTWKRGACGDACGTCDGSGHAAQARPPPPPVAYYDWSGAYIGFNAGGVWNEINRTFKVGGAVNPNFGTNDSDGIFGFHAGAQWQWGAWVLGVEAALSGCFKECLSNTGTLPVAAGFPANTSAQHKLTNLFTVGP